RCQVLHREDTCAVSSVEIVSGDELAGDVVPAPAGVAVPPPRHNRLGGRPGRGGPARETVAAKRLYLVDLRRIGLAVKRKWTGGTELRRAPHQERLDAADPRSGV